jgi:hypothetical protein
MSFLGNQMNNKFEKIKLGCSSSKCTPLYRSVKRKKFGGVSSIGGICDYCGVSVQLGLELHDGRKICPMCHCCFHLDHAGTKNAGIMIHVGEENLSQAQVNNICFLMFMTKISDEDGIEKVRAESDRIYGLLENRSLGLGSIIMAGSPNGGEATPQKKNLLQADFPLNVVSPSFFAQHIAATSNQNICLEGVRFLPYPAPFSPWVVAWAEDFLEKYPVSLWSATLERLKFITEPNLENDRS